MTTEQVITIDNPAGLLLTPELLQEIGVHVGDQIKVSVSEGTLTVHPFDETLTEKERLDEPRAAKSVKEGATATFRELINQELNDRGVAEATGVKVIFTGGQEFFFTNLEDQRLNDMVRRIDIKEIILMQTAKASGPSMDEIMRDLLDRRRAVYEKLAEGAQ